MRAFGLVVSLIWGGFVMATAGCSSSESVATPDNPLVEKPINSGPAHWVLKAGLHGLVDWMTTGTSLPEAERLAVTEERDAFQLDALGNVLGGIRTNYVDVPVAILSGEGQAGETCCRIFGTTSLFSDARLSQLHLTEQAYVDAVRASKDAAVEAGFLLPPDAALIVADAETSGIGGPRDWP